MSTKSGFCGLGPCRPRWLLNFAKTSWFTFFACLVVLVQGAYSGYMMGLITTIEKRFKIPSYKSGALLSCYDFGMACSLLLVGQLGAKLHKPRWIGLGALLNFVGCLGLALPHFVYGPFSADNIMHDEFGSLEDGDSVVQLEHVELCFRGNVSSVDISFNGGVKSDSRSAFFMLAAFQIICGIGSSIFSPLTLVYIDDNASQKRSFFYLGLVTAMWSYGPALGFGLAAFCTRMFVTLTSPPSFITPSSAHWLGAWWLGFVLLSVLSMLVSIPFFFYPEKLKKIDAVEDALFAKNAIDQVECVALNETLDQSLKTKKSSSLVLDLAKMPQGIVDLLRNKIFLCATGSSLFWAYIIGGYSVFLPKYLEAHFHQSSHLANIYGGLIAILGSATGCVVGGKLLSIFNAKMTTALSWMSASMFAALCLYLSFSLLKCPQKSIIGLGSSRGYNETEANVECMNDCGCSLSNFEPICSGGKEYFSPCLAGCQVINITEKNTMYDSCACSGNSLATSGYCSETCNDILILYLVGTFLAGFIASLFSVSWSMSLIKSVLPEQKSMSYAFGNFITSIAGFIPSAVLFGAAVDSTCLLWSEASEKSGNKQSYCLLYDNDSFRYRFHLLTGAFVTLSLVCCLLCTHFSKNFHFHK